MNAEQKKDIQQFEAYDLEELKNQVEKQHNGNYTVLEQKKKREYQFPFSLKTKYLMKIEVMRQIENEEQKAMKKTILDSLRKDKENKGEAPKLAGEKQIRAHLLEQEVAEEIVDRWANEIKSIEYETLTEEQVINKFKDKIQLTLDKRKSPLLNGVCLFFGVTGIGKTTTVVKIAKKLEAYKKVGIITTDNYKMGAYSQIEQYAQKLNIPLKKSKVNELDFPINALRYGEGKDVVLIDTAGRSPKHPEMKDEIENYIKQIKPDRNILVLAANQKYKDLRFTANVFEQTGITDFIITKTDETDSYGFMVNMAEEFDKNILYITDGQEVPDDIREMNGAYWAEQMFADYKN